MRLVAFLAAACAAAAAPPDCGAARIVTFCAPWGGNSWLVNCAFQFNARNLPGPLTPIPAPSHRKQTLALF